MVGYTKHNDNGDKTVSLVTETKAAGSLGIPLPKRILALQASGDLGGKMGVNATFDKAGNLVKVDVTAVAHVQVGVDRAGTRNALQGGRLQDLSIPAADLSPAWGTG